MSRLSYLGTLTHAAKENLPGDNLKCGESPRPPPREIVREGIEALAGGVTEKYYYNNNDNNNSHNENNNDSNDCSNNNNDVMIVNKNKKKIGVVIRKGSILVLECFKMIYENLDLMNLFMKN
jgi:hypothetical protein